MFVLFVPVKTVPIAKFKTICSQSQQQLVWRKVVGNWLGRDTLINNQQIAASTKIASDEMADKLIVGCEVLLRNELTADQIINILLSIYQDRNCC